MSEADWTQLGDGQIQDLMATGREFRIGDRWFRVKDVARGHVSDVGEAYVVGPVQRPGNEWHLGLYNAPKTLDGAIPREGLPLTCVLNLELIRFAVVDDAPGVL